MLDTKEIALTLEHLRSVFEQLVMRGLGSASPDQINTLRSIREECEKIGAYYLAKSVGTVLDGIHSDPRAGAKALMSAQAALRVFDRILTLETAKASLELGTGLYDEDDDFDEDDFDEDEDDEDEDDV